MNEKQVALNIKSIYDRRCAALYALALKYAGLAINYFRAQQNNETYWKNQTSDAKNRMFTNAFIEDNVIGWFMAHGVEYGPYLELSNNGAHEAIRPIIIEFAAKFIDDAKKIFGVAA